MTIRLLRAERRRQRAEDSDRLHGRGQHQRAETALRRHLSALSANTARSWSNQHAETTHAGIFPAVVPV